MKLRRQTKRLKPPHTKNYHKIIGESNPSRPFRAVASVATSFTAELLSGRLVIDKIPQATIDYDGPAIFVATHRATRDIPDDIKMINRAGFDSARPVSKKEWFGNWFKAGFFHALGAFAVDRESKFGLVGAVKASKRLLERGQNILIYEEGTRIQESTREVADILGASVMIAAEANVPIIILATAGAAVDDERHMYGLGTPIIGTISEPLYFTQEQVLKRTEANRLGAIALKECMQAQLDKAYAIRDGMIA